MKRLEKQLKALRDHLAKLSARADKAPGQARRRLKRLERRTRVKVERTVRALEPKVRRAVAEAAVIARGVRAGVATYPPTARVARASARPVSRHDHRQRGFSR
jgi:hypothetical protein